MSREKTPYRQIDAIGQHLYDALRADSDLATALGRTGDEICAAWCGYQAFESRDDGLAVYATQLPCIAIWPKKMKLAIVRGNYGQDVELGLQYLYKGVVGERDTPARAMSVAHLHAVWWAICQHLQNPTALLSSGGIDEIGANEATLIPPLENAVCGLDGDASARYSYPPWPVRVKADLAQIWGEYTLGNPDDLTHPVVTDLMESHTNDLDH